MLRLFAFILCLAAVQSSYAQNRSDLELSSHKIRYFGDSVLLQEITEAAREQHPHVLVSREEICEQDVVEVGELVVQGNTYLVVSIYTGLGISCRGNYRIIFFKDQTLYGYYTTDLIFPKETSGSTLLCQYESGRDYVIDFKEGFPETLLLSSPPIVQFQNVSNDEKKD
jgi:hypothetical protein